MFNLHVMTTESIGIFAVVSLILRIGVHGAIILLSELLVCVQYISMTTDSIGICAAV